MKKDSQMNTGIRKVASGGWWGGGGDDGSTLLKVPTFPPGHAAPSSPSLFFIIVICRVFASVPHLSISESEFVFEKLAIIAKWLSCFSKHGEALRWSLVSGPGS